MHKINDTRKPAWPTAQPTERGSVYEAVCTLLSAPGRYGRETALNLLGEPLTGVWSRWARDPETLPPQGSKTVALDEKMRQNLAVGELPSLYEVGLRRFCPTCRAEAGQNCKAPKLSRSPYMRIDYPPTHKARYRYWVRVQQWAELRERRAMLEELGFDV